MAEQRTVRSPKENVAESELLIVQDAQTQIKELIVASYRNGEERLVTLQKVATVIKSSVKDLPSQRQETVKKALIGSYQRWDATYARTLQTSNAALLAQVQKLAKTSPKVINQNKTYSIDISSWAKSQSPSEQQVIIDKFRPYLTEDKRGAAIIDNYDKRVKERLKFLANDPATANPTDINGKALNLRNLVESEVRYEANQNDIKRLGEEGVDLVWTSSHADCSHRCEPWQGRLYSISGKSGTTASGERYTPLQEATDGINNDGNGIINGYNCRHRLVEYMPGTKAPKEYDAKTIRKENAINNRQREFERDIRNLKIEERLARADGDTSVASQLRKDWQSKRDDYISFSQKNERPYFLWRTRIVQGEQ